VKIQEDVSLSKFTTLGTGGVARRFAKPELVGELADLLAWAEENDIPTAPVGLGSNLLVADEGFPGLALKLDGVLAAVKIREGRLIAGGGAPLAVCLHRARAAELGGIEFVCAIPGTVGGGVWMNAGAYGNDIAAVLVQAHVVDGRSARWLTPDELGLRYRRSDLVRGQVVSGAEFRLQPKPEAEIKETVREMQQRRKDAQPTNKRTFGACGLKGHRIGGAQISPKHANFIENTGGASSADALALIAEARKRALEQFGVRLEAEVQLLGPIEIPPLPG